MGLETGWVVIVAAVLIFYLRLIILQQQRAKQVRQAALAASQAKTKKGSKTHVPAPAAPSLTILSTRRRDWVIAGLGVILMVVGILLNRTLIPGAALQAYWWLPLAIGIIGFSWAFR